MLLLFLKASQLGLFDKLVPVAGSVTKEGVVRAPHMAVRKVKLHTAAAPQHHAQGDLFAAPPPTAKKPEPASKPKAPETLDLFAERPAPKRDIGERLARLAERRDPDGIERAKVPAAIPASAVVPKVDYDKPFDPAAVPSFGVPAGTSKEQRRRINAEAAAMVSGDVATRKAPDFAILRQYSGNGGCGDSLNEFYTDPQVAAAMWKVLHDLGVGEGATALEPSCATGVFLEVAPAGVKVTGVELDEVSSRIATLLHPAQEIRNASLERFAREDGRQFDVVIGNAPFGLRGSLLKDDKKDLSTAEGYFLDTALDKTRGGGLVAMIVPTGVLDSRRDRALRERLLRKGEFLGAMRMPNTAFEHSHTGVTTDVVFFRKRPDDVAGALGAVDQATLKRLGVWDDEFLAGSYFTDGRGAGNILGTMTEGWRAKAGMGDDITVEGSMAGVPEAIAEFEPDAAEPSRLTVEDVLASAPEEEHARIRAGAMSRPYETLRRGETKVVDGVTYILEGDPLRWHRVDEFATSQAITDAQTLAAEIELALQDEGYAAATGLADKVRAYVQAHGVPAKNPDLQIAARTDKVLYRLIGAVKPDGSLSDLVEGRHAAPVESSFDAAAQSLALEHEWFTPDQVAARWHNGDVETVLDHLYASPEYALDPETGLWTSMDQYLSGELWPKLDRAREMLASDALAGADRAKVERQAARLEETIDQKSLEDVEVALNSAFLPTKVISAFFNAKKAALAAEGNAWAGQQPDMVIEFDRGIYTVHGGLHDRELLDKYLNRSGVRKDDLPTIERWNSEFKDWLCAAPFRDEVENLYNRSFRGFRQRAYSDVPFEVPGLNPEGLKSYQWSGLRWALEAGKGIVAADVGLGKTARGLILARLLKATGRAKRPMIVVPKSVLANWVAEAEKWFPGSNVLVIGETYTRDKAGNLKAKQDTAAERNRKYHDLTQNDYDFILISQPAWNDLDLDPKTKGDYVDSDFWVQRGDRMGNEGDARLKKIRAARESYEQQIAKRDFERRTDAIWFNDLGVDAIIGDEMHAYKNLYAARNRFGQQPKFLGGQGLSNRALDMNLKARWVREHNGGLNVYGLTATPTKNSPLEVYSMLSHIAPEAFERIGVRNSEEFLDRFCEFRTENILNTRGDIEESLVTAGFKNLDELREIMRRYIDRKTAEDVGLVLPKRDDRQHLVEMSPAQKEVYEELREQAKEAKGGDATGEAHIFSVMNRMAKAAMDLELLDPKRYAGAVSPKYAEAAKHIVAGAAEGGQVVFADNVDVHEKMAQQLAAGGIPRDQIAIINAQVAASSAARQNIADAFNAGKLKVVIGNTATMGEGINLQKGTTDIHHLDLPWEPASVQQRNGRGLRQGNLKEAVRIHTYLSRGSFDGYRYQSMSAKKDWQDLLWNGGNRVENLAREGALSRDDLMVMLAADPEKARDELSKNKAAAQAKFEAARHTEAAEDFGRFREMKRSFEAMKPAERNKASGERLRVRLDRLRAALEENPYFKAKHALDAKESIIIHPETGDAYQKGVAFELSPESELAKGGGKFVVETADPKHNAIWVRRYGSTSRFPMAFDVAKLHRDAKPFEYDEKAEADEAAAAMASAAEEKLQTLSKYEDLHGLPSAVIERAYDSIQKQIRDGVKDYKFSMPYGDVGMIDVNGNPVATDSYAARSAPHDFMLPTDEHRRKAVEAYIADEKAKTFGTTHVPGRRGSAGTWKAAVKYPGKYDQPSNRWKGILDNVFGKGTSEAAHAEFERQQLEAARRAPNFTEALDHAAKAATGQYGTMNAWPKKALAVLWAQAKRQGVLDEPLNKLLPSKMEYGRAKAAIPDEVFRYGPHDYPSSVAHLPVREALMKLAKARGHHDLASAMISAGAVPEEQAAKELLNSPPGAHVGHGLRHLIAKNPGLGERRAKEFDRIEGARPGYGYGSAGTPAHPLHTRFGPAAGDMTLNEIADGLTDGSEPEVRDAA